MDFKKIQILFIIPSLYVGGSERVMIHLIRNFNRAKFEITLLVLNKSGELIKEIPSDIKVIFLNHSRIALSIYSIFKIVWKLKPHIVFSTLGHLNLLIAGLKRVLPSKTLYVARESNTVSIHNKEEKYPRLFDFLFRTVYPNLDRIICQGQYMRDDLIKNFNVESIKIDIINNPVDFNIIPSRGMNVKSETINLISVGNLRPQKGYERILRGLQKCKASYRYQIIGGGNSVNLKELILELSIDDRVVINGKVNDPLVFYQSSDCLILGSYYEGFPNSVLEANACGLPVIAFKSPGGHNEIIINGVNGWLVDDAVEMNELIESKAFQKLDKEEIISLTYKRYNMNLIIDQYEQVLIKALNG